MGLPTLKGVLEVACPVLHSAFLILCRFILLCIDLWQNSEECQSAKNYLVLKLEIHSQLMPWISRDLAPLSHVSSQNKKDHFFQANYTKTVEQEFSVRC